METKPMQIINIASQHPGSRLHFDKQAVSIPRNVFTTQPAGAIRRPLTHI
jgi:hypothetical protein